MIRWYLSFPGKLKTRIADAFLNMNKTEKWNTELQKWQMWGFKPIDMSLYDKEKQLCKLSKSHHLNPISSQLPLHNEDNSHTSNIL